MEMPEKIRALLAKASNTPYEEEAALFYEKAQQLMEKYAIDEEALWAGVHGASEKPIVETMTFKGDGASDKFSLITALALANRCQAWKEYSGDRSYVVKIAGYPSDIAFIQLMFTSLSLQMTTAMVFAMIEAGDVSRGWKINFMEGYTSRIAARLREAQRARQSANDSVGTGLVLAREKKVHDYLTKDLGMRFRNLSGPSRNRNPDAYNAGKNAANNADLNINPKLRKTPELR